MNTTAKSLVLAALLIGAIAAPAAQVPASSPQTALAVLAPLIGADWRAALPTGQLTDTQHFEWMYDHMFIRSPHHVDTADGKTVYTGETVYGWDARAHQIVWWYWNETGGYLTGTLTPNPDSSLFLEGENHGPADQLDRTRQTIRIANDSWTMESSEQKAGHWTPAVTRTFQKVK
jgi:hypothetical protein